MAYIFGEKSLSKLVECEADLQAVAHGALGLNIMDFAVIEGHRVKSKQDEYFNAGKSKIQWPAGKHNRYPSQAVDIVPYVNGTVSWNNFHCCVLAGIILAVAKSRGIKIRWGGNWDMDGEPITDQDFQDLVHFEKV